MIPGALVDTMLAVWIPGLEGEGVEIGKPAGISPLAWAIASCAGTLTSSRHAAGTAPFSVVLFTAPDPCVSHCTTPTVDARADDQGVVPDRPYQSKQNAQWSET